MTGFVYVIGLGDGLMKIGISNNPLARLGGLQTASPQKLVLVETFERPHGDARWVERTAHRLLHAHRQEGTEWFSVTAREAIEAVRKACEAGDARAIKALPTRVAITSDSTPQGKQEALEWAKANPGPLARQIRKWHGT